MAQHDTQQTIADALVKARAGLEQELKAIEKRLDRLARANEPTRRLMTTPGVGAIVALTFAAAIDDPARFRSSRMGGAFWSDAAQAPVRRDRCEGAHLPDRGSWCAGGAL